MEPGSSSLTVLPLLLVLIGFHALLAAAEAAILSVRKSRLLQLVEEGNKRAQLLLDISDDSVRLLTAMQLLLKLAVVLSAVLATSAVAAPLEGWLEGAPVAWLSAVAPTLSLLILTIGLVFVLLTFGELIPKQLVGRHAEPFALFIARPVRLLFGLFKPLVQGVIGFSRLVTCSSDNGRMVLPYITEEEIKTIVDAGEIEGIIEQDEREMIYSIFNFGDTLAREVMVPRIDVVALDVDTPLMDALDVIIKAGHSRIPVYEETIDNIVGMLYAKDLLACFRRGVNEMSLRDLLRDVFFVPETKKVDELLQELQLRKVHVAVVVDEYGGTAGLVTIEDILEEIVGEIQDEYDTEEEMTEVISPTEAVFNARVDLDDVNHLMSLNLPVDESDTLGGLVYSELGRVPLAGDTITLGNVRITVLSVIGRRIKKVRVEVVPDTEAEEEAEAAGAEPAAEQQTAEGRSSGLLGQGNFKAG